MQTEKSEKAKNRHWTNQVNRMKRHPIVINGVKKHREIWGGYYKEYETLRPHILVNGKIIKSDRYWDYSNLDKEKVDIEKLATIIVKFQRLIATHKLACVTLDIKKPKDRDNERFGRMERDRDYEMNNLFSSTQGYRADVTHKLCQTMWSGFKPHIKAYIKDVEEFTLVCKLGQKYFHHWIEGKHKLKDEISEYCLANEGQVEIDYKTKEQGYREHRNALNIHTIYDPKLLAKGRLQFPLSCIKYVLSKVYKANPRTKHKQIVLYIEENKVTWGLKETKDDD